MVLNVGHVATNFEIKARWAYSEIVSSRIGRMYQEYPPLAEVSRLALDGVPFDAVPPGLHKALADAVTISHGGSMPLMDRHRSFVLSHWSRQDLARAYVDKYFNTPNREAPLRFSDFLTWPRNTGPNGESVWNDPRIVADTLPRGTRPATGEAPIVVHGDLIIDGYLRSTLFYRDAAPADMLAVWVGTSE